MKTNTTPEQIKSIIAALASLHIMPFEVKSSDPKYNAQRNLNGKTHYVEDDTLKFHHSRISSSRDIHGGLLFRVTGSDAMDMRNTKRGFRTAVFDVFGTCVSRPELENATTSADKALKISDALEIDLAEHYRKAIAEQLKHAQTHAAELEKALTMF
jgi:hypothetical protein